MHVPPVNIRRMFTMRRTTCKTRDIRMYCILHASNNILHHLSACSRYPIKQIMSSNNIYYTYFIRSAIAKGAPEVCKLPAVEDQVMERVSEARVGA